MNLSAVFLIALSPIVSFSADRLSIGLTATRTPIEAVSVPGTSPDPPVIAIVGGMAGQRDEIVAREVDRYAASRKRPYRLLAIGLANPDKVRLAFPPVGQAYKDNPESHYLWRWIAMQAPDFVLIASDEDYGLAAALARDSVAGVGRIPTRRVHPAPGMLSSLPKNIPRSEARVEMGRRLARTPRQVADELAVYYGHELDEAVYIPAMALIGRLRLGHEAEVARIVAPFVDGSKDSLAKATSSHLAGHLVFGELTERTKDARYIALVRKAADLGFTDTGEMKEAMPLHNEMSDSVFMGCPILAKAGKLTGDRRYFDLMLRHLQFMQKLCLRPDGIYRHSPLDQAAWGRGNAFPALGLALSLSDLPAGSGVFDDALRAYQSHMKALASFQDENGMWRQIVDLPGSYPEFSATAMIAIAMSRGIRSGWLDARSYQPLVDNAWRALKMRISADGQ